MRDKTLVLMVAFLFGMYMASLFRVFTLGSEVYLLNEEITKLEHTIEDLESKNAALEEECKQLRAKDIIGALARPMSARARYLMSLTKEEWDAEVDRCNRTDCTG